MTATAAIARSRPAWVERMLQITAVLLLVGHISGAMACLYDQGVMPVKPRDCTLALAAISLLLVLVNRPSISLPVLGLLIIPILRLGDASMLKRFDNIALGDHTVAVMILANVLLVTLVALLVLCTASGPRIILYAATGVILVGTGSIMYEAAGLAQYSNIPGRAAGFVTQPNEAIIVVCLMLGIVLTLNDHFWSNAAIIAVAAVGVGLTLSRSGMVVFAPMVLGYLLVNLRKHLAKIILIIMVSIPAAVAGIALLTQSAESRNFGTDKNARERIEAIFGGNTDKMESTERLKDLTDGWEAVGDSPLFGHGTGSASSHWQPHNQWVAIWLDIGVIGVVLYATILIGLTSRCVLAKGRGFLCLLPLWGFSVFSQNLVELTGYWLCAGVATLVVSRSRVLIAWRSQGKVTVPNEALSA